MCKQVTPCTSPRKPVGWSCMALEKASTGQTWRHTNHVTYQQASQDHHCQAQHLLRFLLTPPYPIQAGDERKTSLDVGTSVGHCRENHCFLNLWVRCAGLPGCSTVSTPVQRLQHPCRCWGPHMQTVRDGVAAACRGVWALSVHYWLLLLNRATLDKLLNLSTPHLFF